MKSHFCGSSETIPNRSTYSFRVADIFLVPFVQNRDPHCDLKNLTLYDVPIFLLMLGRFMKVTALNIARFCMMTSAVCDFPLWIIAMWTQNFLISVDAWKIHEK